MQLNQATLLQSIQQNKLFPPNARLLIAVSGGADSLALLHLLAHLRRQYPIQLFVASLNHGIRPEAADEVAFVEAVARQWNLPFMSAHVDVPALAHLEGIGIESAARKARYDFLATCVAQVQADFLVTAHHADDQSETILMHIIRGSGLKGLEAMASTAPLPFHPQYRLVRPLLPFSRLAIEAYCEANQLQARHDPSNQDTTILRNYIRHEIVPRLRLINPQIAKSLSRLAEIAAVDQAYIAQQFESEIKTKLNFSERITIPKSEFLGWHLALQRRVLIAAYEFFNLDANFERIEFAIHLVKTASVGAIAELGGHLSLRLDYDALYIEDERLSIVPEDYIQISQTIPIAIPIELTLGQFQLSISTTPIPDANARLSIPTNATLSLRTRQSGDTFRPLGMEGHQRKLKKWLIDRKVPQAIRDNLPLLEINEEVAAILLGDKWSISETFAVQEDTPLVVYFKVKKL